MGCRGWTLVELLAGLALAAVCLCLAVPSQLQAQRARRVEAAARGLAQSLELARLESLVRGEGVSVCASADGLRCTPGVGWQRGWVVFADPDAALEPSADERIQVQQALAGVGISGNQPVRDYVHFAAGGWPRQRGGALQMGRLRVCAAAGAGQELVLAASGRLQRRRLDCAA